jgi:hypothetical protein
VGIRKEVKKFEIGGGRWKGTASGRRGKERTMRKEE